MTLRGSGVLITEGSRGIGKAVALRLTREGALFVSGAPADDADLRTTVAELLTAGAQAAALADDVADAATVAGLINAARWMTALVAPRGGRDQGLDGAQEAGVHAR